MKTKMLALALCAITITGTAGFAKTAKPTVRDEAQAACFEDAQRLCGDVMPDEEKVVACMKPRKAEVSAKCAAFYDKKM